MFILICKLHLATHANYAFFQYRLSSGWLFGRRVVSTFIKRDRVDHRHNHAIRDATSIQDNSDSQYRAFRNNIPALAFLVLVHVALKSIYTRCATRSISGMPTDKTFLVPFTLLFAILYLIGLHGTSVLKIFIILTANYCIGKSFARSRAGPIITWIFNFLILFANERNEGYLFSSLHPDLAPLVSELLSCATPSHLPSGHF